MCMPLICLECFLELKYPQKKIENINSSTRRKDMSDNKFKVIEGGAGKTPGLTILLTEKERKFLLDECIIDDPDIIEAIETAPLNGKNYTLTLPDEDMEHLDGCVSFVYGEYAAENHGGNSVDECGMNNKLNSIRRNSGRKSAEVHFLACSRRSAVYYPAFQ